uniref:Uncharacterized protein n=1 Tax=Fagus sylvatica TaxID=28930 RepID=A0A2N9FY18_FAGSY
MTSSTLIRWSFKGVRGRVTQYAAPVAERSKSRERKRERPTTLGPVGVGCESILVGVCFAVGWGGLHGGSRWFVGLLAVVVRGFGRANRGH